MMKAGKGPQLQDLQKKEGELEGFPEFLWLWEKPIGFVGACETLEGCRCSWDYFSLSYPSAYHFLEEKLSLPVTASLLVLDLLPPAQVTMLPVHPCQKSPPPFCSSVLLLLWPQEHFLI